MDDTNRKGLRGLIKSSIHFLVFSSIYIGVCALVMIHQTNQLLNLQYDVFYYYGFVFFSTICSYNFHWGLTPFVETKMVRLGWTVRNKTIHKILFVIGAIGAVWYFFYIREHWFWLSIGIILTFLYSAPKVPYLRTLKNIAVGKTIFLAMVWMYVTTAVPIFISDKNWGFSQILFCASRFLFIYSICILFDYRDRDYDRKEGIRSMITYLDDKGVDKLFLFFVVSIFDYFLNYAMVRAYNFTGRIDTFAWYYYDTIVSSREEKLFRLSLLYYPRWNDDVICIADLDFYLDLQTDKQLTTHII